MIKKVLYSIFICLASFFLMSHNVSAIELTKDVNLVQGNFQSNIYPLSWDSSQAPSCSISSSWQTWIGCNSGNEISLKQFQLSIPDRTYSNGEWIVIPIYLNVTAGSLSSHINYYGLQYNGSRPIDLIDVQLENLTSNSSRILIYLRSYGSFRDTNLSFTGRNGASALIFPGQNAPWQARIGIATVFTEANPSDYTGSINDVKNSVNSINDTLKQQQQQQQQQQEQEKQDANNTIDDSKNSSNSSSSDVQNNSSTQSLLSVITGFFGAITSASPSSCVLTGQINEYLTPSFDLCQLDPPPALTALLSIPVAIALFFFAKHMLNKIIALIRSFQ